MKDIENEIAQVYAKGVLDFLDDCVWHKTIANWNMSNNSGTYRIYDNEDKEIYPQYDKENPSQYRKKRTEEDRLLEVGNISTRPIDMIGDAEGVEVPLSWNVSTPIYLQYIPTSEILNIFEDWLDFLIEAETIKF